MSLTLYFAITSPNLIIGDNKITGAGTTLVTALITILIGLVLLKFSVSKKFKQFVQLIFIKYSRITSLVLVALTICWQLLFVINVHPAIGFDVGAVHDALLHPNSPELRGYFSTNSNNLFILLLQHSITSYFSNTSWLFLDLVTLVLVDISAILNTLSVKIIAPQKVSTIIYLQVLLLAVFPMIIVPYTDTWVIPFVSSYFFCYCLLVKTNNIWIKLFAAIGLGSLSITAYFVKPSSFIGAIAIVIIELMFLLFKKNSQKWWIIGSLALTIFGSAAITYHFEYHTLQQQDYIKVYKNRSVPIVHFISMGVSGDGGYNAQDALQMAKLTTKKQRSEYSKQKLSQRLHKMGVSGYLRFLWKKHNNNTADGSFSWDKEGHFINGTMPSKKGISNLLNQYVYLYGIHLGDFRYLAQLVWVLLLSLIFWDWSDKNKLFQLLRLTIVGAFLYLLIFEGGRSRYLIQFLPFFIILATLSTKQAWNNFSNMFKWLR